MRLHLVVVEGRNERDVVVSADASLTAGALSEALAGAVTTDSGSNPGFRIRRTNRTVAPEELVADLKLRRGDALEVGSFPRRKSAGGVAGASWTAQVIEGPSKGNAVQIDGTVTVGRDPGCDLVVDEDAVSRQHCEFRVEPTRGLAIRDLESTNGTEVDGRLVGEPLVVRLAARVVVGDSVVQLIPPARGADPATQTSRVGFNRPPRFSEPKPEFREKLPAPPTKPTSNRLSVIAGIAPLVLGIVMFVAFKQVAMLAFMALSPVIMVGTWLEDRRKGGRQGRKDREEYFGRVDGAASRAAEAVRREAEWRLRMAPALPELRQRAEQRSATLWERRVGDEDFLSLRLGLGDLRSGVSVEVESGGDDEIRAEALHRIPDVALCRDVPVLLDLGHLGAAGLCGTGDRTAALARSLILQATVLHSPRDLVVAALVGGVAAPEFDFLKWLPHADASAVGSSQPLLSADPQRRGRLLDALVDLAEARADQAEQARGEIRMVPHVLVVLDEDAALEPIAVDRLIAASKGGGISVLWLGLSRSQVPGGCEAVVTAPSSRGSLTARNAAAGAPDFRVEVASLAEARAIALALAPVADLTSAGAQGGLPESISLLEIDASAVELESEMQHRWKEVGALSALVGARSDGPFRLDLRRDGPHGLVAGTTGAGKSELLQTLVASLALSHSPERLNFILVDYKGGAAFKSSVLFPHVVGFVTDLDALATHRALVSLNAELKRRERLLDERGARDIVELEGLGATEGFPNLLIVVDEFAALAREIPEFVDGVVDIAQRGRSLGIHMILATQRPAGVISESIRANTNLRIALRVANNAESLDVVDAPDAASIPRTLPGRALVRLGHDELVAFQSAYVGAPLSAPDSESPVEVAAYAWDSVPRDPAARSSGSATELVAIAESAKRLHERLGLSEPLKPWLEPLPLALRLSDCGAGTTTAPVVGLIDEPKRQRHAPLALDLSAGHALVTGISGSGKTVFLLSLAAALAGTANPSECHLYALDFAGRGLAVLELLPHCAAVATNDEPERVILVLRRLASEVEDRKRLLAENAVARIEDLGNDAPARIALLIDNYSELISALEKIELGEWIDVVKRLMTDGPAVGLHFAITTPKRAVLSGAAPQGVAHRFVLRQAEPDDYLLAGIPSELAKSFSPTPGRGLGPDACEIQIGLPVDDLDDSPIQSMRTLGATLSERYEGVTGPPPVVGLVDQVRLSALEADPAPMTVAIGLREAGGTGVLDLSFSNALVVGPPRSGRSTALRTMGTSWLQSAPSAAAWVVDLRARRATNLSAPGDSVPLDDLASFLQRFSVHPVSGPTLILLDDAELLESDPLAGSALADLARRIHDLPVRIVVAVELSQLPRIYSEWIADFKRGRTGLVLRPEGEFDGDALSTRLPRLSHRRLPPGRGFLIAGGEAHLVQVATAD